MKILHTIPRLRINGGGPPLSTSLTVKGIMDRGMNVEILTYALESADDVNIIDGEFVHFLPSPREKKIAFSKHFAQYLDRHNIYDLYHCHGVWQYPSYITAKIARKFNKPYILTPRGMLYPQDLKKSAFIKKLALKFYMFNDLQKAACIQATCVEEMQHLRALGVKSPIAVIPNPVDTQSFPERELAPKHITRFGYLGRIHPRKNIERLLYAWKELGDEVKDAELLIIGGENNEYGSFLKKEVVRLGLNNVIFTGFLAGNKKNEVVASLSFLAVPSDFENFGMIVAEALLLGVPVIASKGTPWHELETHRCGWWIDNDTSTITKTFRKALAATDAQQAEMGKNGIALIRQNYSVEVIAERVDELYQWILHESKKPEFVYLS